MYPPSSTAPRRPLSWYQVSQWLLLLSAIFGSLLFGTVLLKAIAGVALIICVFWICFLLVRRAQAEDRRYTSENYHAPIDG